MTLRPRTLSALAVSSLLLTGLPALGFSTASAADEAPRRTTSVDREFEYACDLYAGFDPNEPLPEDPLAVGYPVGIRTVFDVPRLYPGRVVAPTSVAVDVKLPEFLRDFTTNVFLGEAVEGSSSDANLEVSAGGQGQEYLIGGLSAPKQDIPTEAGAPWVIKTTGTSPAITVPDAPRVRLSAPKTFTIQSTIYRTDGEEQPIVLDCTAPADRALATIRVSKLYPKLSVKSVPSTIVAGRTTPTITVKGYSEATPTGAFEVYEGSTRLASGALSNGSGVATLPKLGKRGTRTFTVKYLGDTANNGVSASTSVTVR